MCGDTLVALGSLGDNSDRAEARCHQAFSEEKNETNQSIRQTVYTELEVPEPLKAQ